jgi:ATP-binding cassette subfamily B multidrug efflux pump
MLLRLIRTYLGPSRRLLALVVLFQGAQAAANLYLPSLSAALINRGVMGRDTGEIWRIGGVMLIVTFIQATFAIAAIYVGSRAAMAFGRDVRAALFSRVTRFSGREVNAFGAASLVNRITNDVQQVQMFVVMACTLAVSAPFTAIGGVIMAMRQDLGLSAMLIVSIPAAALCMGFLIVRTLSHFRQLQEQVDGISRLLREQLSGIRVVRAFVREPEERARFDTANVAVTRTSLATGRLMALMFPVVLLIINGTSVALVWWGGRRITDGQTTIGSLVAFLTYFTLVLLAVMMASFVGVMAPRAAVCADRIQLVLDTESTVIAPARPVGAMPRPAEVEVRDVTFGYPRASLPVLSHVSFAIAPGRTTAVIGSTGSGKTTLVNLVARLFDVTDGAVLVGGVDVRELDPSVLWSRIGLVPQRSYLFSGTIRSNLQYGKTDATDDECWEALEIAQATDFVRSMPDGLDTRIEQGGLNVSGGQRQRLAIARAVVRRPDVYLFDDCFSALDVTTDARLRAALEAERRRAAVLLVSQRVSTIAEADQILVLEDGIAVGLGTHDELLQTCSTYAEISASQLYSQGAA